TALFSNFPENCSINTPCPVGINPTQQNSYYMNLAFWQSDALFSCQSTFSNYPTSVATMQGQLNLRDANGNAVTNYPCPLARAPYQCPDYTKIKHASCRQPSFGPDPNPGACGATTDTYYSAPGLTLAQLQKSDPAAAIVADGKGGFVPAANTAMPACLTGEDLPMDTQAAAQNKQAQLLSRITTASTTGFPSPVNNTALLAELVTNAKLTFEVAGGELSGAAGDVIHDDTVGDQIAASLALYTRYTAAADTPQCGHSPATPDLSKCAINRLTTGQLNTLLNMCERFRSDHASPQLRSREEVFTACLALGAKVAKMRSASETDDGTDTNFGNDTCQFKQYRDRWDEVVTLPLHEMLATEVDPRVSTDETARRLSRIDAWFQNEESLYTGASTDTARWTAASDTIGAFWRGMYRNLYPMGDPYAPPSSELAAVVPTTDGGVGVAGGGSTVPVTVTADQIYAAAHDELDADRAILTSAFTPWVSGIGKQANVAPTVPLTHAPLLYVVADTLTTMHQRLTDLALYHDVGCAYLGCSGDAFPSEAARLWRLLAYVGDTGKLTADLSTDQLLKDETGTLVVRSTWLPAFNALATNHAAFDSALADAYPRPAATDGGADAAAWAPPSLITAPLASIPPAVLPLATLVRDAASKAQAYTGSGLLLGPADHLRAGAHDEYLTSRRTTLTTLNGDLANDVQGYRAAMQNLASAAIQQFDFAAIGSQANTNILQTLADIDTLQSQEQALRAGINDSDRAFANHMDGYAALAKINPNGSVSLGSTPELLIGASAAKALGPAPLQQNIGTIAAAAPVTLTPGQVLHVQTSGQYAPACAIAQAPQEIIPGQSQPQTIGAANPFVGPEGYLLQVQGSQIQTESHQQAAASQTSNSTSSTFAACGGMKTSLTFKTPGLAELFSPATASTEIYASIEGCSKSDDGTTDSNTTSDTSNTSSDGHVSASFNAGLRLPDTPFPNLPAGALLLVVTPQNQPTVIKDILVVQEPATEYVADGNVAAYYVVNDLSAATSSSCKPDDSKKLDVQGSIVMHTGQFVNGLQPVIGNVIQTIAAQRPNIVAQGRLLPEVAASLRASAMQTISAAGLDVTTFPASVQSFLDAWLDAVLARMELEITHNQVVLDLNSKILSLKQVVQDLNNANQRGRVATLLGNWALRDLDETSIRDDGRLVADMLLNEMYPVILLRDRSLLATLSTEGAFRNSLLALIRTPWDGAIDDIGNGLNQAAKRVLDGLAAVDGTKPEVTQDLVLEIPRPGVPPSTSWYIADQGRASDFWTGLSGPSHIGSITLQPDDFYRKGGGLGLSCAYEAPVILDMAVVFAGIDDTVAANENARTWQTQVTTSATMLFPTGAILGTDPSSNLPVVFNAGGPLTLDVTDPAWTAPLDRIFFAKNAGAVDSLFIQMRNDPNADNAARGLSPFTTFTFDMSQLWNPENWPPPDPNVDSTNPGDAATALEIILRVQARSVGTGSALTWIHQCAK
ncbi:MAG TPA: hypothetical protein VGI39_13285, partial [Polyangiaceae bacterium]